MPRGLSAVAIALTLVASGCDPERPERGPSSEASPVETRTYSLGGFPAFPNAALPEATAAALQAELDEVVEDGTFKGVAATVIVADRGNWTGAAGTWDGTRLTTASRLPTHSAGKNIVAAQILRLVEEGELALDDPAADHVPPELDFFDANGATIEEVLAMRSGIPDLNEDEGYYPAEQASSATKVFTKLPDPKVRPGTETHYASTNYVLLGTIIEEVRGRSLAEILSSDVLDHPGLEGIVYTVEDALAGDGWGVEATPASLARWGYELYGGFVLADDSLRALTEVKGEDFGLGYGLGVVDFSDDYGTLALGHPGESSRTTCCSSIRLVALPEEGIVISVQANTRGAESSDPFGQVGLLTHALRAAARG